MRLVFGSKLPAVQLSPPVRNISGVSPHVSPPGSPGRATVDVRHTSSPVCASRAEMKQGISFASWYRSQPLVLAITFPRTTMGPAV